MDWDEFSAKVKYQKVAFGRLRRRTCEPRIDVLEIVCDMFKLTLDDLLRSDQPTIRQLSGTAQSHETNQCTGANTFCTCKNCHQGILPDMAIMSLLTNSIHLRCQWFRVAIIGHLKLLGLNAAYPSGSIIVGEKN